ncbi:transcription factor IIIA-like [Oppia nitens]|uniref:transcription factor IIIA-like n=1 Tax=Oppia nitens TaxID=1686743 RepID=UPI0023DBA43F|nr:transcription factor IIIA-like [Oppia nitens]
MTGQSDTESIDDVVMKNNDVTNEAKVVSRVRTQFMCSYIGCNAVFNRMYRLDRHVRHHTGEKPFVCHIDGCDRSFSCKSYLSKHLKRPHKITDKITTEKNMSDDKPEEDSEKKCLKGYTCNECNKLFKTKFQLKMHCFQHSGVKPFLCDKCDKRFVTKNKLKSHLKTHDGYACGRDNCDYKATKWSELRKHIAVEHKLLKCNSCDKTFNTSFNLNLHQKNIHLNGGQKFICNHENCGKSYSNESNLRTHIRSKHSNQLFNCTHEDCDKTFLHKKSLTQHMETHLKGSIKKVKKVNKIYPKKSIISAKLASIELNENEKKRLIKYDFEFRNQLQTSNDPDFDENIQNV